MPAQIKLITIINQGIVAGSQSFSTATMNRLIIAMGSSPFQAKLINWSTRSLGRVLRIQTITKNTIIILISSQIIGGSTGPCQPPRNRVEMIAQCTIV